MKLNIQRTLMTVVICSSVLISQTPVQGGIIASESATEALVGVNGLVVIGEFGDAFTGYYRVDVADGVALTGFAVSTEAPDATTPRAGWSALNLSSGDWDTLGLGTFSSFFGPGETRVNYYFLSGVGASLSDTDDQDQFPPGSGSWDALEIPEFLFGSSAASEFVAFGKDGVVVDYSRQTAGVPDASSTFGLLSTALVTLGWRCRRNR